MKYVRFTGHFILLVYAGNLNAHTVISLGRNEASHLAFQKFWYGYVAGMQKSMHKLESRVRSILNVYAFVLCKIAPQWPLQKIGFFKNSPTFAFLAGMPHSAAAKATENSRVLAFAHHPRAGARAYACRIREAAPFQRHFLLVADKDRIEYNTYMKKLLFGMLCGMLLFGCTRPEALPPQGNGTPVIIDAPQTTGQTAVRQTDTPMQGDVLSVLFINVGYGDAALICCGDRAMLIDTGEKTAVPQVFAALHYMGVESLDAVALTHTHSDHIGGMEALGRSLPVKQVYAAVISENKKNGENKVTQLCEKLDLPLERLNAGDTLPLAGALAFDVLGPLQYNAEDDNDNSLVLRLRMNGRTLLFTGDMQFAEEATLLNARTDLDADILKVGNHGNPDATSDEFGRAASPSLAVISTSTIEDGDSANPRVLAALPGAETHITQDYPLGVLVTVDAAGTVSVSSPETQHSGVSLSMTLDTGAQLLTLENTGADEADLSGFVLLSERGGECFRFPAGARLAGGARLTLSAAGGGGDYAFIGEDKPWNQKKGDTALLYDVGGHLIADAAG